MYRHMEPCLSLLVVLHRVFTSWFLVAILLKEILDVGKKGTALGGFGRSVRVLNPFGILPVPLQCYSHVAG